MAQVELVMPKMGESIIEATILKWVKQVGEPVEEDETILEIATDKVDSEVPSPVAGTLVEIRYSEDEVVEIGKVIALIETAVEATPAEQDSQPLADEKETEVMAPVAISTTAENTATDKQRFYSPLVRNIAAQENISLEELETLTGTGANGRVTKHDILNYLKSRNKTNVTPANPQQQETVAIAPANTNTATQAAQFPVFKPDAAPNQQVSTIVKNNAQVELIEMDRMRRLIADHMVRSKQTSPHVSSFVEADVTNIVQWRNRAKKEFQSKYGEKLTYTPIFVEAVAKAIRDFPMVNVSVEGTTIIKKNQVHIGMATALPSGNLIVPVIKNADQKNLVGLAKSVNDLVARARTNKLQATEIQDGTFTITNIGTFGNVLGTPIINQPQVAILAVGAIQKKPAVVETPEGDFIGIRHLMYLSLSYDHRVVDGFLGGSFLRKIADYLEDFDPNRGV